MQHETNRILVTGAYRSGTTWAGKILATAPRATYIHEPFNVAFPCRETSIRMTHWFQRLTDDSDGPEKRAFHDLFSLKLHVPRFRRTHLRHPHWYAEEIAEWLKRTVRPPVTIIMKDPIALLSTDWLVRNFNVKPVVMIRHPAALVSSLKVKQWFFNFNNFLEQPTAVDEFFPEEQDEIARIASNQNKDIVYEGALLWRLLHKVVLSFRREHPEWIYLRHEDISLDPHNEFERLFSNLALEYTPQTESMLKTTTIAANRSYERDSSPVSNVIRNSKENIQVWKQRLSNDEIDVIRTVAGETASSMYSSDEW